MIRIDHDTYLDRAAILGTPLREPPSPQNGAASAARVVKATATFYCSDRGKGDGVDVSAILCSGTTVVGATLAGRDRLWPPHSIVAVSIPISNPAEWDDCQRCALVLAMVSDGDSLWYFDVALLLEFEHGGRLRGVWRDRELAPGRGATVGWALTPHPSTPR